MSELSEACKPIGSEQLAVMNRLVRKEVAGRPPHPEAIELVAAISPTTTWEEALGRVNYQMLYVSDGLEAAAEAFTSIMGAAFKAGEPEGGAIYQATQPLARELLNKVDLLCSIKMTCG